VKKNILVIIGGRGIGDLIYHLPLLKSLYKTYKRKILILSNRTNQAKEVFKNEIFYEKIIYFDNQRLNLFKTIKNIFKFKKIINSYNPKYVYLTSTTLDLESFVGKTVMVKGETMAAQSAPWLMDVWVIKELE